MSDRKSMQKVMTKSIIKELEQSQCMFFWSKKWIFQNSLINSSDAWAITKQVYFRNVRKHRALAFALPYIVIEVPLARETRQNMEPSIIGVGLWSNSEYWNYCR
jgi:hypothetical protein